MLQLYFTFLTDYDTISKRSDSMKIKSCKYCNRAFGYNGGPVMLCSKCDDLLWDKVKTYLNEHPNASAKEVSSETKVKLDIIDDFLADDRLSIINENNNMEFNKCQGCGNIIDKGEHYCKSCLEKENKKKLLNEISELYKNEQNEIISVNYTGSRMYTSDNNKKGRIR